LKPTIKLKIERNSLVIHESRDAMGEKTYNNFNYQNLFKRDTSRKGSIMIKPVWVMLILQGNGFQKKNMQALA